MYKTITSFVTTLLLLGVENHVCNAQFGVAGNKKGSASSFESMNEQAKKQYEGGGLADMMDMGALADMLGGEVDMAELEALVAEAMSDPETMEEMMKMQKEMMQAMNQLGDMSPEELMKTAADAVEAMMDTDVLDSMFEDTDALIEQLEQSGMVDAAMIAKYKANPELLKTDMQEGIAQMKQAFDDPETINAAMQAMSSFGELMSDPKALNDAMKGVSDLMGSLSSDMSNDDKIEEARLKILSDPSFGGNNGLASIYGTDEMKELLSDSTKWRDAVKLGKGMMFNDEL